MLFECNAFITYTFDVSYKCNFISNNCWCNYAALSGTGDSIFSTSRVFGFVAIMLAAINIFGGFLVTQRMLQMYKKKDKKKKK